MLRTSILFFNDSLLVLHPYAANIAPIINVVQCVEYLYIMGGMNPSTEATRITRFRPSLSDMMPPGNWTRSVVSDCIVVSNPIELLVPPSSRMYRPKNGAQIIQANMVMLLVMAMVITFLFESTVFRDCVRVAIRGFSGI